MRIIILPDDGQEWVAVPKGALDMVMHAAFPLQPCEDVYFDMIAAAPQCKVVELPERKGDDDWGDLATFNDCLDEIERRAKS